MKIVGIYKITNPIGSVYIGRSVDIKNRWSSYKGLRCKDQPKLYNSFKKYGIGNHLFEILIKCKRCDLEKNEKFYVDYYNSINNGLNTATVGSYPKWKTKFDKKMQTISITYTLKWRFINYPHIQITTCRKVINVKTGRIKKQCLNGGSLGYWIDTKTFITRKKLNKNIEIITKEDCPF